MSVRPTDASYICLVKMANGQIVADMVIPFFPTFRLPHFDACGPGCHGGSRGSYPKSREFHLILMRVARVSRWFSWVLSLSCPKSREFRLILMRVARVSR
jgi:hypothetical protein